MEFTDMLSKAIGSKEISILELARAVGMTKGYIKLICSGECNPSPELLRDLCHILDLDYHEAYRAVRWRRGRGTQEI